MMEHWKIANQEFIPQELTLSSEDKSDQEVNYLDLHLKIENSTINYINCTINATNLVLLLLISRI